MSQKMIAREVQNNTGNATIITKKEEAPCLEPIPKNLISGIDDLRKLSSLNRFPSVVSTRNGRGGSRGIGIGIGIGINNRQNATASKNATVPIDHGTDRKLTQCLENEYGAEGAQDAPPISTPKPMGSFNININTPAQDTFVPPVQILTISKDNIPLLSYAQVLFFMEGVFSYIYARSSTMTKDDILKTAKRIGKNGMSLLLENNITLEQIYFHIEGMQSFKDLLDVGLRKEHLFIIAEVASFNSVGDTLVPKRLLEPAVLAQMYHADRLVLQDKLGLVLGDCFVLNENSGMIPFRIRELSAMGWTMDIMVGLGLRKEQFAVLATEDNEIHREQKKLIELLGTRKDHLISRSGLVPTSAQNKPNLNIGVTDFEEWGWEMQETIKAFGLDNDDLIRFGEEKRRREKNSEIKHEKKLVPKR